MQHLETPVFAIGLMSGTSADGVDAALIRTDGETSTEFLDAVTVPYDHGFRERLIRVAKTDVGFHELLRIERELTEQHVFACETLIRRAASEVSAAGITVIGFHGHTIRHLADEGLTWQIGNGSLLAEKLAIPVVFDFRRRDIAAGGQGAPLSALFHQHALAHIEKPTVVVNLGGVANLTWLGPESEILAGDSGPGCGLLDEWVQRRTGQLFDRDGVLASAGTVDQHAVDMALRDAFFAKPLPKSADRFDFAFAHLEHLSPEDGAKTLCAITVAGVLRSVSQLPMTPKSIWVSGGGVNHPTLLQMLGNQLPGVQPIDRAGLRADSLESECFAWLAVRRLRGLPTSMPATTGTGHSTSGGILTT